MVVEKKYLIAGCFSLLCASLAVLLFISLCWTAAADAQGAVAFAFFAPVLILLLFGGFYLGRKASKETRTGIYGVRLSLIISILILLFYVSPFVGLSKFSDGVIGAVAKSFEMITGKYPMQWDKNL